MACFGTYRLTYTPSGEGSPIEPAIDMRISGEASLAEMLSTFESFLLASGYQIGDQELVLETRLNVSPSDQSYWDEDGISLVGNPWTDFGRDDDRIFVGSGVRGGMSSDVVKFS